MSFEHLENMGIQKSPTENPGRIVLTKNNRIPMKYKCFLAVVAGLSLSLSAAAQTKDGDTEPIDMGDMTIYNEYTPSIKDANRIQPIPVIIDTVVVQPRFEYSVFSVQYPTSFSPAPLQAADLKPEPLAPLDNGWVKLGFGNYLSPYIEANYHNLRSKDYSLGAFARHHSAHGKINNSIDQKVYAGYNDNDIRLYGKKFLTKSTLFSNISFASREDYFYGVNPSLIDVVDIPLIRTDMEKQRYNVFGINAGVNSNNTGKNELNYDFMLDYRYLKAIDTTHQHYFGIDLNMNKAVKKLNVGADVEFTLYKTNIIDSSWIVPSFRPYVQLNDKQWQIRLGVNGTGEFSGDSSRYHLYPDVLIQHNISNTLIPYASFRGNLQFNDLERAGFENPYTSYRLMLEPTNYAQIIDLGIKGNIDRKIRFNLKGNYSKIDNMYFYVIDTASELKNKFTTVYSNVERFSGYGEIVVAANDKLNVFLNGHYYWYSYIKSEDKPWHMPNFDVNLFARYQFNKELSFGAGVYVTGTRWTKNPDAVDADDHFKMKPFFDINLNAEYKIASNFSGFIYLNNIAAQKYYIWDGYRAHGFNVMLGLTYSF